MEKLPAKPMKNEKWKYEKSAGSEGYLSRGVEHLQKDGPGLESAIFLGGLDPSKKKGLGAQAFLF